ncbi:MAG: metal-sensitive transcriptional regulator [Polyangiaceae bacterium]|jgi:DNA-binding FrmR family transcriptional regulator
MPRKDLQDSTAKDKVLARLRSVEGHVRSIVEMVQNDAYCIDVLQQTSAVRSAVAKVEAILLERHLDHCVQRAMRADDTSERERVLRELLDVFEAGRR